MLHFGLPPRFRSDVKIIQVLRYSHGLFKLLYAEKLSTRSNWSMSMLMLLLFSNQLYIFVVFASSMFIYIIAVIISKSYFLSDVFFVFCCLSVDHQVSSYSKISQAVTVPLWRNFPPGSHNESLNIWNLPIDKITVQPPSSISLGGALCQIPNCRMTNVRMCGNLIHINRNGPKVEY